MTGVWKTTIDGGLDTFFDKVSAMGIDFLDWRKDEHRGKPWAGQNDALFASVKASDLFVLILSDPSHHYFSSVQQLGVAMDHKIPILVLDPHSGSHEYFDAKKGHYGGRDGTHKICAGVHTLAARGRCKFKIVKTEGEVFEHLDLLIGRS